MANRRMFHKDLVSSDKFIDMPLSSQALFFHLGMSADDDGFVSSPKRIQRSIGCSEDDLKILIAKNFIYCFESGVVVVIDWNKHNQIRKDRYTPTLHVDEKCALQLIENQCGLPNGNQMATIGKPSIGKVSIKKDSPQKQVSEVSMSDKRKIKEERFEKFWNVYDFKKEKKKALLNFMKLTDEQVEEVARNVKRYVENTNTDGTYPSRMYPARYLNPKNELWKDEVVEINNNREVEVNSGY